MDYEKLATELLRVQADFSHLPIGISISEISEGEYLALRLLSVSDAPSSPSYISKKMKVSMARVSAMLGRLEKKGLITRAHSHDDERRISVILTGKGRDVTAAKTDATVKKLCTVLEKLSPKDAEEYVRLRKAVLSAANELKEVPL